MIKEVIVVEGRDDLAAVKQAVEAEIIVTNGLGLEPELLERLRLVAERKGLIILTDPDQPGQLIRARIKEAIPGVKDAYLPRVEATKEADIGVENAPPAAIRQALEKARAEEETTSPRFSRRDLLRLGLLGSPKASQYRRQVGARLGIGYANGKQFLSRLNNYGISPEELWTAVDKVGDGD